MIEKVISGGQTGADRAGLDVAIELGIDHGGWCPAGRKASGGPIPERYRLTETEESTYPPRTEQNVVDSNATVIFISGAAMTPGSLLTERLCKKHDRPYKIINVRSLDTEEAASEIVSLIEENDVKVLNVAGSRESKSPGIYFLTFEALTEAIECLE